MKIVLDTNIWIYLTQDPMNKILNEFVRLIHEKEIKVYINDIILEEWKRNKSNTIENLTKQIKGEYRSALSLANYLDETEKKSFLQTLEGYKHEEDRIQKATQKVNDIQDLMEGCEKLTLTKSQKQFVADLAIKKLPPFQNNKNNFNDALIVRNICENVNKNLPWKHDLVYVTKNLTDVIDKDTGKIYEDLLDGLIEIEVVSVNDLGHALKLAPQLIEDWEDWVDSMLEWEAEYQYDLRRGK